MQNTSPTVVGRRALIKGAAMLAVAATARAQGQPPAAEQPTTLADVPLGPSVTVTVERRGDIVLVGLNRPFIQNRIDPPTRLRLAATFYQYEHDPSLRALVLFGHGEHFLASDPSALGGLTEKVVYLHDRQMCVVSADEWHMLDQGNYGSGARWHLRTAIEKDDIELARWCLEHGANPNAAPERDQRFPQRSLYEHAMRMRRPEMVSLLLELGADPLTVDGSGFPAAAYATAPDVDRRAMEEIREMTSAMPVTSSPAARALSTDAESSRSPTTTSAPESLRLSEWAWPCEP